MTFSLFKNYLIYTFFEVVCLNIMYLALVIEINIVGYYLLYYNSTPLLIKNSNQL